MNDATAHLTLALVGRPNVGKSTLFNRLVGRRQAIVDPTPGATVDRHYGVAELGGCEYTLIDTGGFEPEPDGDLLAAMRRQSLLAIEEADVVLLLFDAPAGLCHGDEELVKRLRRAHKPTLYVVNKIDGPRHEPMMADFYSLGLDPLYPISAEHGVGVSEVIERLVTDHPSAPRDALREEGEVRVAVIGRPNTGKSTLVNRLLGEERHAVTDIPGTTRDALDSVLRRGETVYRIIDTAGIRRQKRVDNVLEKRTIVKAFKAMDRADVALILLDAIEGITDQDQKIADFAVQKGLGLILAVNKWDAVTKDGKTADQLTKIVMQKFPFASFAPVIYVSAQSGQRVEKLLPMVSQVAAERARRVSTGELNRWLKNAIERTHPPTIKGRMLKIYYISQVASRPPTFMLSVNDPLRLKESYQRYLVNQLREEFGFAGTPLKFFARKRGQRKSEEGEE